MQIPIPEIFAIWNGKHTFSSEKLKTVAEVTEGRGRADECIACGQCEGACPQQLPVIELLKKCSVEFDQ